MDYRALLKRLEKTAEAIEASPSISVMLRGIIDSVLKDLGKELGVSGGRIYEQTNNHYQLIYQTGDSRAPENYTISMEYPIIQKVRREGQIFVKDSDAIYDPKIEGPLNIAFFAAISLGDNDEYLISFTLNEPIDEMHIQYSLTLIRHVANLKIRHRRLESYIAEARKIQASLLPQEFPEFFGFDLYGQSKPAEIVGGDVFDVIPISESILGIAFADASGHGLPAALQVRDVVIGLRMGIEKDMKIVRTMQKLNSVLHHAGKNHEFIAMVYAELEDNGNFFYVNAGHHPPLFFGHEKVHELTRGGLIMGPYLKAKYERGFLFFEKGNLLVMYSDGVTEAVNSVGEEFGTKGIIDIVQANRGATAKNLVKLIFDANDLHLAGDPAKDDRSLFIIKKD
jgi:sigma-B regulation protein RsbU (phosphoserine phosphatase)